MGSKRKYEIAFVGLKPGVHEFNYELNETFFKEKGAEDAENIVAKYENGVLHLELPKKEEAKIQPKEISIQ